MTIKIYPSQEPGSEYEEFPWEGTIAGFFDKRGYKFREKEVQPGLLFVNGQQIPVTEWEKVTVTNADLVQITTVPGGGVFKLVGGVFNFFFGWLLPKAGSGPRDPGQGRQLSTAEGKANVAKLNGIVPELFGRFIRYPEYLVPPRRYFSSPREQRLEMLLCVGPGRYEIDPATIKIGNTPLTTIEGAEYYIHQPGDDLSGHSLAENWYPCPEVGGTSAGTAGLDLTASPDSGITPTGGSFTFEGGGVITSDANFPSSWGSGTAMSLLFAQPVVVTRIDTSSDPQIPAWVNELVGDWREIAPAVGQQLNVSGIYTGAARIAAVDVDANGYGKLRLEIWVGSDPGSWKPLDGLPLGNQNIAVSRAGRVYVVQSVSGQEVVLAPQGVSGWAGFAPRTVTAADAQWSVQDDTVYGESVGPIVLLPAGETTTTFEVDFFFPQGLNRINDEGKVRERSVGVVVEYRDAAGGPWQVLERVYTQATLDKIGFTERITSASPIRPEVRVRRRGARGASTQVNDVLQWYAARCLLGSPASYPWTTISLRVHGLGQIAASSENLVNLVATLMLPTLKPDGSCSDLQPTRDISAAVRHICTKAGNDLDSIHMQELRRLHEIWTVRGETFDHVFDEVTVDAALSAALMAGMAEYTIDDGLLRPVRDGIRTLEGRTYSAQNTIDGIARSFTAIRPDDNDGVEVEYCDEEDNWNTKTIACVLPGSLGVKLEKLKLNGVTSRTRAWRIGMRRARQLRYERWNYSIKTELDIWSEVYGNFVVLVDDIPGFGQSALLTGIESVAGQARLEVTEPMRWDTDEPHVVAYRKPDGQLAGPWPATQGRNEFEVLAPIPANEWPQIKLPELPHVFFGPVSRWHFPAIVKKVKRSGNSGEGQFVNYDARIFADDDNFPPAE